jgi:hypothetical protein
MKKLIMTLAAFCLLMSAPAFAGCGSHGGGYSRAYSAPSSARQYSTAAAERRAVTPKAAKTMTAKAAREAAIAAAEDAAEAKLANQAVAAVEAIAGTNDLAPITSEVTRECKQYSATIGALISIACE